jgi:pimeloyl-ACP methyl ester carboxylesterase
MHTLAPEKGIPVTYDKFGSGPPLVLVHGSFSDQVSNWELVLPHFEQQFTVYAIARRGRGETAATEGHTLEDEASDVAGLIEAIGEPVFLLGHSYGAQTAVAAAAMVPDRVRKLVLYEPPWPSLFKPEVVASLTARAEAGDWDGFTVSFFHDVLLVPMEELDALKPTALWPPILADAKATLEDVRALSKYDFRPERFAGLRMPVLLQVGTESPRNLYVTDALSAILPDARVEALEGQAHEGMTTAPGPYAEAVTRFLLA